MQFKHNNISMGTGVTAWLFGAEPTGLRKEGHTWTLNCNDIKGHPGTRAHTHRGGECLCTGAFPTNTPIYVYSTTFLTPSFCRTLPVF